MRIHELKANLPVPQKTIPPDGVSQTPQLSQVLEARLKTSSLSEDQCDTTEVTYQQKKHDSPDFLYTLFLQS